MRSSKAFFPILMTLSCFCSGCSFGQDADKAAQADFTVKSICVNKDTKSLQITADYSGNDVDHLNTYTLSGLKLVDIEVLSNGQENEIIWSGFYEQESAYESIEILNGYSGTAEPAERVEQVAITAEPEFVEAQKYDVAAGLGSAAVWLTPFSAVIQPSEGWREADRVYAVLALDSEGSYSYVSQLPVMDDRSSKEQKEHPLSDAGFKDKDKIDPGDITPIAEDAGTGAVLDSDGFCFVTCRNMDIGSIVHIEIVPYIFP